MPEKKVLLVIDLQHGIVEPSPEAGPRSTPNLTASVMRILQAWRKLNWPIVHLVHHDTNPEHPLNKDTNPAGHRPHLCASPNEGEPVLLKTAGSAFVHWDLNLAGKLVDFGGPNAQVVIIGMDGAQCVNDNSRGGCDHGFRMTVVADACASFGTPHYLPGRKALSAEDTHVAAMSILANGFASVLTADDLLRELPL